jgi:hypothetical protein
MAAGRCLLAYPEWKAVNPLLLQLICKQHFLLTSTTPMAPDTCPMCGRLQILEGLGFEFGEVAQITDDWEMHFDQLLDWLLWLDADDDTSNPGHSIGWCVSVFTGTMHACAASRA